MRFKNDNEVMEITIIKPELLIILADMNLYCQKRNLPFTVTRMVDVKIPGISVSSTHEEGRAFDASVHRWSETDILIFTNHFNDKYNESYGAISFKDRKPHTVVYHDGTAPHFHVQIRPNL